MSDSPKKSSIGRVFGWIGAAVATAIAVGSAVTIFLGPAIPVSFTQQQAQAMLNAKVNPETPFVVEKRFLFRDTIFTTEEADLVFREDGKVVMTAPFTVSWGNSTAEGEATVAAGVRYAGQQFYLKDPVVERWNISDYVLSERAGVAKRLGERAIGAISGFLADGDKDEKETITTEVKNQIKTWTRERLMHMANNTPIYTWQPKTWYEQLASTSLKSIEVVQEKFNAEIKVGGIVANIWFFIIVAGVAVLFVIGMARSGGLESLLLFGALGSCGMTPFG